MPPSLYSWSAGTRSSQRSTVTRSRPSRGGAKKRYRVIDFKRQLWDVRATVERLEYDPNRSAHIALLHYRDGEKRYVLAPAGVAVGDLLESGPDAEIRPGNALPINQIPLGTVLHAIEMKPGKGAQLVRAAGLGAQLMAREGRYATLRMPSGEHRKILVDCLATIGTVGNSDHENQTVGKAGRSRWRGQRGNVRGVAMNPVDHPHGGGNHQAVHGPNSVSHGSPPGQKVGHIAPSRTGRGGRSKKKQE